MNRRHFIARLSGLLAAIGLTPRVINAAPKAGRVRVDLRQYATITPYYKDRTGRLVHGEPVRMPRDGEALRMTITNDTNRTMEITQLGWRRSS